MDERIGRRELLRCLALGGAAVPIIGTVLSACDRTPEPSPVASAAAARLPLYPDNAPIAAGLPIERGATLRILEWKDYLSRDVIDGFTKRFAAQDVRVEVRSFLQVEAGVSELAAAKLPFDIFFPTIDVLERLVAGRVLAPLNHDYLPHLPNLWPQFRGPSAPFYDAGQRYSVPYTVYSSGVGWRSDLVRPADAPDRRAEPFDIAWDPRYRGKVGLYDDYLEALSYALLRDGVTALASADDAQLRTAADALRTARRRTALRFTVDGAEEGLPRGEFAAHQAWSGDVVAAPRYGPGPRDLTASLLRYWSPQGRAKVVGCDLIAVCARGENPVLAHAFIDHLLRFDVAMDNFAWNGYQPPLEGVTPDAFADPSFPWRSAVPENLQDALLTPESFAQGQFLVGFGPSQRARWLAQWKRVVPRD